MRYRSSGGTRRANFSISAMRPLRYSLLEEIVILGVIYGILVWRVCNPAAPAGPRGIPELSPDTDTGTETGQACPTDVYATGTETDVYATGKETDVYATHAGTQDDR